VGRLLAAFAGFQPVAVDRQQARDFLHAIRRDSPGVPVMNVLGFRAPELCESRGGDVRCFQECLESWTASVLSHKHRVYGRARAV
jgi:hypothetical protein